MAEQMVDKTQEEKRKRLALDGGVEKLVKRLMKASRDGLENQRRDILVQAMVFDEGYLQTACLEAEEIV